MSGSGNDRQASLRLIVPAAMLALVSALLVASLLLPTAQVTAAPREESIAAVETETTDLEDDVLEADADEVTPTEAPVAALPAAPVRTPVPVTAATPAPTATPTWSGPPTFTFVALGVDQRNDREIPRTDTIMIGQVDMRGPSVTVVSVPRDLLVEIPGYGKDRINSAYVYGEQYKEPGGGIGLLQRTIQKSFGIQIDHFGMVDFQCFRTAVDSVGGVTVNVPRAIVDPKYPTEDYGTKIVKFDPGLQVMDGERALEYARTRYADNDFQRMQRQQLIISAMREQMLQLRSLPAIPTLLSGCRNMRSDLGWREYLTLATSLRSLDSKSVSFAAINETMVVDSVLPSGAAVLLPRWEVIRPMLSERFAALSGPVRTVGATTGQARPGASPAALASPAPFASPALLASPAPFASPLPTATPRTESVADTSKDVLPGDALTPVVPNARRS